MQRPLDDTLKLFERSEFGHINRKLDCDCNDGLKLAKQIRSPPVMLIDYEHQEAAIAVGCDKVSAN